MRKGRFVSGKIAHFGWLTVVTETVPGSFTNARKDVPRAVVNRKTLPLSSVEDAAVQASY
jgi:hypothetical protein